LETKKVILVIEDEKPICHFMTTILTANGYRVVSSGKGLEIAPLVSSHCPDALLLDLGLPDVDGIEALRGLREWSDIPVIVVSARGGERDKVAALDLGADDYVTKPFGPAELLARIRAALRHAASRQGDGAGAAETVFTIGGLRVDSGKMSATLDGEEIHFTPIEFRIVELLARNHGKVMTHASILKRVWGPYCADTQALRVNMANIRRKIEQNPADPRYIRTEVGVGYRMADE
jgi:two-component system, OmpR family, KDP operon response regulator KdpE